MKPIKPGVYYDLDMKEYHADPALSRSDIVRLNLSPDLYKTHEDKDKPWFRIGRAIHDFVLKKIEPVVNPDTLRTKIGKAFQADYPDAVPQETADMIKEMAERTRPFFQEGDAEVSFFWEEMVGDMPVMCKCRPDWLTSVIYDFKTTRQALEDFHWDIRKFFYDVQHAWYLRGVEQHLPVVTFRLIVVEKSLPHRVRIFEIENLNRAEDMIENGLAVYRQCTESGIWYKPDMEVYPV